MMSQLSIRLLQPQDSLTELTQLLHRAYARLGAMGLNYTAVNQSADVTAKRIASGTCFVAAAGEVIAGTVTVSGPYDPAVQTWALQTPWFYRTDTAHFHQLAVDPQFQGHGIGDQLVQHCEAWAVEQRYQYMALDTAVDAHHLRSRYSKLGYRDEGEVQWEGKVYRSIIMAKQLSSAQS
jgi:GNAT superfamily N-acetyltransferase